MTHPRIDVVDVSKAYKRYSSFWKRVLSWFGCEFTPLEEVKVLQNISFRVFEGESVALVGQNGAGKSTLLKLISGILSPTQGHISVVGRVSSILELGIGFNAELTGGENIRHLCGMMGISQARIEGLMPEIQAFSELGDYLSKPIKTYSSGMQARLAFSIATAQRPEVLIVDEALSVGDVYFQHKSFARMKEFVSQGTTLLFVSHDMGAVKSLCDRAILLDQGTFVKSGRPDEIADYYNAMIAKKGGENIELSLHPTGKVQTVSGTGEARVSDIYLLNTKDERIDFVMVGQQVQLIIEVQTHADLSKLVLGYMIKDQWGRDVFGTNTHHTQQVVSNARAGTSLKFKIDFSANLGPGSYSVSTALCDSETHYENNFEWKDLAFLFKVGNLNQTHFDGNTWIPSQITMEVA